MRKRSIRIPHGKKSGTVVESVESPEMLTDEQQGEEEKDVDLSRKGREADIPLQVQHHECMRQVHESIP